MSTYGDMQSRIADDLHRTDQTTQIRTAIQNAVRRYERERFWFNEARATASTTDGTSTYAVPTDYMSGLRLEITVNSSTYPLTLRSIDYIDSVDVSGTEGQPNDYAILAEEFRLYPVPDSSSYTLTLTYNKSLGSLSATTDTNAWMVEAEDLIRHEAEAEVNEQLGYSDLADRCYMLAERALKNLREHTGRYIGSGNIMPSYW